MGPLFTSILDVTLVYPEGPAQFWDMCCGRHVEVHITVRERPVEQWLFEGDYQEDREFRRRVHRWIADIWQEKDELLQRSLDDQGAA
jgi:hypothetical protein